ncbi:MAG: hypothetical protein LUI06_02830 [Ruminococcus sp.]|nr:hypothetical protein [Ruminococcus sp.]
MKKKNCPFCGKEISDEAIICKFCHKLLIDENGNDLEVGQIEEEEETELDDKVYESYEQAQAEYTDESDDIQEDAVSEDKTIVYSKEELQKALGELSNSEDDFIEQAQQNLDDERAENVITPEEGAKLEDMDDEHTVYTYENDDEYAEHSTDEIYDEYAGSDDYGAYEGEYDDAQEEPEEQEADYDPKRTFLITAIITVGILIIIIAAVCVGSKLFGEGNDDSSSDSSSKEATTTSAVETEAVESEETTESAEAVDAYVPEVTDDTTSEEPEETTADSEEEDPVVDDSSDEDDETDESAADESEADDSESESTGSSDGAPSFSPAGSYYSWDEVYTLWENYMSANGMTGSYSYNGGTDAVEMFFLYTDESGNSTNYRVDLATGYVTAQ